MSTRSQTRFTPGEEIDAVTQWSFGAVDARAARFAAKAKLQEETADIATAEASRQAGFEDGFAQGHATAILEAQKQIDEHIRTQNTNNAQQFVKLFESANAQLHASEQTMAQGVLELACELAKTIVRREISIDPSIVLPVIGDALTMIVGDGKCARVKLNPADLATLMGPIEAEYPGFDLKLSADSEVRRGGCLVESMGAVVDGTVQKRWMRAVATLGMEVPWDIHEGAEGPLDE